MQRQEVNILPSIKDTIAQVIPTGAQVILFGSQARGDAREDSDWDLLILLDKEQLEESDHDKYVYPFFELGWMLDAQIHPMIYTKKDWQNRSYSSLYKNVEQDGVVLC